MRASDCERPFASRAVRRPDRITSAKIQTSQRDPYWRDNLLFDEYFHGDDGAGIGASHQTGWTGVTASLIDLFGRIDSRRWVGGRPPPVSLQREKA